MKQQHFEGVAVHPTWVSPRQATMVAVWLSTPISATEHELLLEQNVSLRGHLGVRVEKRGTFITYLGRLPSRRKARELACMLANIVVRVTGIRSTLCELPDYLTISRAMAPMAA